jgi:hypothetical protein
MLVLTSGIVVRRWSQRRRAVKDTYKNRIHRLANGLCLQCADVVGMWTGQDTTGLAFTSLIDIKIRFSE